MKKQVTAVIDEVKDILGNQYNVNTKALDLLSTEDIKTIQANILEGLKNGDIEYKKDVTDEKTLKTYADGLVTNHLRKCKQLNGNITYTPSGNGPKRDDQLREMTNLLKSGKYEQDTEEYRAIEEAMTTRKAVLATTKAKAKAKVKAADIDTSVLPPELQGLAQLNSDS